MTERFENNYYLLSFLLAALRFERFFASEGLEVVDVLEMTVAGLAMWNSLESSSGSTSVVVAESLPAVAAGFAAGLAAMFSLDLDLMRWRSLVRDIFRWLDE